MPYPANPHAALADFSARTMRAYAAGYRDLSDPVNKNRLAALSALEGWISRHFRPSLFSGGFAGQKKRLMRLIESCATDFEPPFDSSYGSGKGVFGTFQGEVESLHGLEDCWPTRYIVAAHDKASGEHVEDFRLSGVKQAAFKRLFAPQNRGDILTGSFPATPEHQLFLDSFIPVQQSLGKKLSSALKTVKWDFDSRTYTLKSITYDPSF